jgi:hypothetical protein
MSMKIKKVNLKVLNLSLEAKTSFCAIKIIKYLLNLNIFERMSNIFEIMSN